MGISIELGSPAARPFTTFNFRVEVKVDGVAERVSSAAFSEVDGLEMTMEPKTIREGGRNTGPVHLTGPVSYGQLTLKRGLTANRDFWTWFEALVSGGRRGLRADAEVVMLAADGTTEQARFKLTGCMPVKLKMPALNAKDGVVAIEEMQIAYETLSVRAPSGALSAGI
jgi:phage tail-like protein